MPLLHFILGYGFKSIHGGGFSKRKIRGKEGMFCHRNGEPPASLPFLLSHFYSSCPKLKSGFVTQAFQGPLFAGMSLSWKSDTILLPSLSRSPSRSPILVNTWPFLGSSHPGSYGQLAKSVGPGCVIPSFLSLQMLGLAKSNVAITC